MEKDIKERETQKHTIHQQVSKLEEKELETNRNQMEKILTKEQQNVNERRLDRQKADSLSIQNVQQKRQSNVYRLLNVNFKLNQFSTQIITVQTVNHFSLV